MRKVIIAVLFILVIVGAIFTYQNEITKFFLKTAEKSVEQVEEVVINAIAFLNDMRGNVAYKRSRETTWSIGQRQLGFEVFDTLSTGPNSNAILGFNVGHIFNLDENSLIVIQEPMEDVPNLTEVDFSQGTFRVSNDTTEDAVLKVHTDNMTSETRGVFDYSMEVDKKNRKAKVSVFVGSVKLTDTLGNEEWVMVNQTKEFSTQDLSISLVEEKEEVIPVIEEQPKVEEKPKPKPKPKKRPRRKPAPVVKKELPKPSTQERIWKSISSEKIKIDQCVAGKEVDKGSQINMMVEVRRDGIVMDIDITNSTVKNKSVVDCIVSSIKSTKFEKFDSEQLSIKEEVVLVFN